MRPHPPYRVSARAQRTAGALRPVEVRGGYDPSGFRVLTVFVHGYNNSESRALARWDDDIWPGIRDPTRSPIDGVVLFFWPGDSSRFKVVSRPQYWRRVPTAIAAGVELSSYIRRIADINPGLHVQFVGHSLGCRVVLSAVHELSKEPRIVPVVPILLMGAAVPEGDCAAPGPWPERVATTGEVVLHSRDDEGLSRFFPGGELLARRMAGVGSSGSHVAVGLTGGPPGRWSGEPDSCGLDHDDYPRHPSALRHVAGLFGPLADRPAAERKLGEHRLFEHQPDESLPESAPPLG